MSRDLNASDPEDAVWVSCPECDSRPGDSCILDQALSDTPGFDKAVHAARIQAMHNLSELHECLTCEGTGSIECPDDMDPEEWDYECPDCGGSGEVA